MNQFLGMAAQTTETTLLFQPLQGEIPDLGGSARMRIKNVSPPRFIHQKQTL